MWKDFGYITVLFGVYSIPCDSWLSCSQLIYLLCLCSVYVRVAGLQNQDPFSVYLLFDILNQCDNLIFRHFLFLGFSLCCRSSAVLFCLQSVRCCSAFLSPSSCFTLAFPPPLSFHLELSVLCVYCICLLPHHLSPPFSFWSASPFSLSPTLCCSIWLSNLWIFNQSPSSFLVGRLLFWACQWLSIAAVWLRAWRGIQY